MQVLLVLIARSMKLDMNMLVSSHGPYTPAEYCPTKLFELMAWLYTWLNWSERWLHPSEPGYDSIVFVWHNQVWIIPGVELGERIHILGANPHPRCEYTFQVQIHIPENLCTALLYLSEPRHNIARAKWTRAGDIDCQFLWVLQRIPSKSNYGLFRECAWVYWPDSDLGILIMRILLVMKRAISM